MIAVTHPETATTPAEYGSSHEQACARCMVFIDLDEDRYTEIDETLPGFTYTKKILCADCRTMCAGNCDNWITSPSKAIKLRCPVTGKLEQWCPECAAEDWPQRLTDHWDEHHPHTQLRDGYKLDRTQVSIINLFHVIGGAR